MNESDDSDLLVWVPAPQHNTVVLLQYSILYFSFWLRHQRKRPPKTERARCDAMRCDAMRCDAMRCDVM